MEWKARTRAWFAICHQQVLLVTASPVFLEGFWVGVWKLSTKPQVEE